MRSLASVIAVLALACSEPPRPPRLGAVRVQTGIEGASLFVDALERGALHDGMEVRLTPGPHVLEARRGERVVARAQVEAQPARIFDVQLLDASPAPAPVVEEHPEPPAPAPDPPSSAGQLSASDIRSVVSAHGPALQQCYERWAQGEQDPGRVRMDAEVSIVADGSVTRATVRGGDERHAPVRQCMEGQMREWRFPAAGDTTVTTIPFIFNAAGPVETPTRSTTSATPSRTDVVDAMRAVTSEVQACGRGHSGLVPVRIVFGSSGEANSAQVTSDALPPDVRSCVERAARGARVPPFSQPSFSVNYPFRL